MTTHWSQKHWASQEKTNPEECRGLEQVVHQLISMGFCVTVDHQSCHDRVEELFSCMPPIVVEEHILQNDDDIGYGTPKFEGAIRSQGSPHPLKRGEQ